MDRHAARPAALAPPPDWVPRRLIDVGDYHRMGEAEILGEDDRVELIEGELIAMSPVSVPHSLCINRLNRLLVLGLGDNAIVSVQNPVRLGDFSEPQPDFALLRPASPNYAKTPPLPEDVFLLIEVAASSLRYDVAVKAALYARYGIAEYWVVDVEARRVLRHRDPTQLGYARTEEVRDGAAIAPLALPALSLALADFLP
jgi:Uma2 family endonuclease